MDKYQPSNGTEGCWFMEKFCENCIYENPDPESSRKCEIITATMILSVNDPEYPSEWTYDENDNPICTRFTKWDWGNDGDPDDPDNPNKPPDPPDPNQINLFPLYPNEETCEPLKQLKKDL